MSSLTRLAAAILAALSIALGAVGLVSAADDPYGSPMPGTLGASVSAIVIADEDPAFHIVNRGAVRMTFDATAPDGWGVSPASIELDPGAEGVINLTGSGDAGLATVYGRATVPSAGDATAIRFGSIQVMQTRPFDPTRYFPMIGGSIVALALLILAARRFRPWELRVARRGAPMA